MKRIVYFFMILFVVASCQAKRVDKPIQEVEGAKDEVQRQKLAVVQFDDRLQPLAQSLRKFKGIYDKSLKFLNQFFGKKELTITPVDLLLEILIANQKGLSDDPELNKSKLGAVDLPFLDLKDECRKIRTQTENQKNELGETLVISIKTCISDQWQVVLTSQWNEGQQAEINTLLDLAPLEAVYRKALNEELQKQNCQMQTNAQGYLTSLICKDLRIKISDNEWLEFPELTYNPAHEFPTRGKLLVTSGDGTTKKSVVFGFNRSGKFELDPPPET